MDHLHSWAAVTWKHLPTVDVSIERILLCSLQTYKWRKNGEQFSNPSRRRMGSLNCAQTMEHKTFLHWRSWTKAQDSTVYATERFNTKHSTRYRCKKASTRERPVLRNQAINKTVVEVKCEVWPILWCWLLTRAWSFCKLAVIGTISGQKTHWLLK